MSRPSVLPITQGRLAGKFAIRAGGVVSYYEEVSNGNGTFCLLLSTPVIQYAYLCEIALQTPGGLLQDYGLTPLTLEQIPYYQSIPEDFEEPYTMD